MKRREFLAASASVILPEIGNAQPKPCPLPTLNVEDGTSASTECVFESPGSAPEWFLDMDDNSWVEIAAGGERTDLPSELRGSRIYDVRPSPSPPGAEGVSAVCNDWTGGCVYQATGEYILPAQGGHNGYYGNEIYSLALREDNPGWRRIWGPTPNADIVTTSFGYNPPYTAYGDGSPRSIHGWFGQFVTVSGRIWITLGYANPVGVWSTEAYSIDRDNLGAGWMYHGRIWPTIPGGSPGSSFGYQSGPGAYDRVSDQIWRAADFMVRDGVAVIDSATSVAAGPQSQSGQSVPGSTIYNTGNHVQLDAAWSAVAHDLSPRCWITGVPRLSKLLIMDVENNPGVWVERTTVGSPAGWTRKTGAVYHAPSRAILVGGSEYGANLRKLSIPSDPINGTYSWSEISPSGGNSVIPSHGGQYQGSYSKFQIIEDMGNGRSALVLVTDVLGPTFVYKLPASV